MTWLIEHFGIISDIAQFLGYFILGAALWLFRNINKVVLEHKRFDESIKYIKSDLKTAKTNVEGRLDAVEESMTLLEAKIKNCQENHGGRTSELILLIKDLTKKLEKIDRSVSFMYGKLCSSNALPIDVLPHMTISDKETDHG